MDIQVWSDVVCPWCYLGRHRLEAALAMFGEDVTVTYRAYQLDPSPVPEPLPVTTVMANAAEMVDRVTAAGAADGLVLDFGRAVTANTFTAHRLIAWAALRDRQSAMLDALQRAHFADGVDLGSVPALAAVAGTIGLDAAEALSYLESQAGTAAVRNDLDEARELGVTSVPTLVIDGKFVIQGAQDPATLLSAFQEIRRRETVEAGR
ncbi:DsbA family oxidoreductase [Actinoplanes rectilineatus]|uniref:DsbA family oxidoreductase n=1 Tax=Actinoplanes rectilineatus TaxID=113571 RepID=UPI0005F2E2A4|nr:DsbA family oxidoreductase [Actinoplanes rectilineatus]